jgi:hypothetical protein
VVDADPELAEAHATIQHLVCWCPASGQPDYYIATNRCR